MSEAEFLCYLLRGRDSLVHVMREGLTKAQVLDLGEVLDGLHRDLRTVYDQPKPRE